MTCIAKLFAIRETNVALSAFLFTNNNNNDIYDHK